MAQNDKVIVNGRGEVQALDPKQQAELVRALVERRSAHPSPAVRRRAIALAGVQVARSIESQRGKA